MSFDVSVFRSNINNQNLFTKENAFELIITLPTGLSKYDSKLVTLNCYVANLPGTSIQGINIKRGSNSLEEEMPLSKSFEDLSVMIRNDGQANIINLFQDWQSLIYNDTGIGTNRNMVAYKSDYASTINLSHFDMLGNQIISYTFQEAYPKNKSGVGFNWDSSGLVSIPVSFRYKRYLKSTNFVDNSSNLTGNQSIDEVTGLPRSSLFNLNNI